MKTFEPWVLAYLLNSVWQVPLIFLAARLLARATRSAGPAIQHRIWVCALVLQVLLPACSFSPVELTQTLWQRLFWFRNPHASIDHAQVTVSVGSGYGHGVLFLPAQILAAIVAVYVCTTGYFALRLGWGLWATRLVSRSSRPAPFTPEALQSWDRACRLFDVHDARALASNELVGPATVGIRRRIVLLPFNFQTAFSSQDLAAALAHEFAHMRRHDFAKNLFYDLLALPVAYHPVMWLTRAHIAETREMVCDSIAAEFNAGPVQYARSLLRLATLFTQRPPAKTIHAIGIFDANTFERRLMNLTHKQIQVKGVRRLAIVVACVLVGSATCASALTLWMNVSAPSLQLTGGQMPDVRTPAGISGGVMAGNRIDGMQPVYPESARDAKISGTVLLHAIIGKDGTITSLKLISGPPELTESARTAVRQWTYRPYLLNGQPTEVATTITVHYSLAP